MMGNAKAAPAVSMVATHEQVEALKKFVCADAMKVGTLRYDIEKGRNSLVELHNEWLADSLGKAALIGMEDYWRYIYTTTSDGYAATPIKG